MTPVSWENQEFRGKSTMIDAGNLCEYRALMPEHPHIRPPAIHPPARLSQRWQWGSRQPISFLMEQAVRNPQVISLAAGLVDQATLPAAEVRWACAALLADETLARQALQYGTTPGADRL